MKSLLVLSLLLVTSTGCSVVARAPGVSVAVGAPGALEAPVVVAPRPYWRPAWRPAWRPYPYWYSRPYRWGY